VDESVAIHRSYGRKEVEVNDSKEEKIGYWVKLERKRESQELVRK
jgi:hypothetical protein